MSQKDKDSDLKRIEELIGIMKANDLEEVEIKHKDDKIHLKRFGPQPYFSGMPVVNAPVPLAAGQAVPVSPGGAVSQAGITEETLIEIKAPIVGTFYSAPSPDSEPYVEIGSEVNEQAVVCIIEAMKVMNEIKAEVEGTIVEILVKNGQAVEYGQVLFKVKPE